MVSRSASVLAVLGIAALLGACVEEKPAPTPTAKTAKSASPPVPTLSSSETQDAGAQTAKQDVKDAGAAPIVDGPLIGALFLQTPVMSDMEWPKEERKPGDRTGSVRLGYIRQGSRVPVIPEPHVKSNCKEGWYELVQGGFVCGKYASLDLNHPRLKLAPHAPTPTSSLPYEYGYNVTNGTPLYRTIPSREDRMKIEPWLAPRKAKPRRDDDAVANSDDLDAGAARSASSSDPSADDGGVPWYLRDYDGGKPQVTLDDLKGEGPVARRMVKGFYLALDHDFSSNGAKWWKTTGGLIAPFERIYVNKSISEFHGVWLDTAEQAPVDPNAANANAANALDGGSSPAPKAIENMCKAGSKAQVGIILHYKAKKYSVSASKKAVTTGDAAPRHTVVRLTGESVNVNGAIYDETDEGWWMKASEGAKTKPTEPPRDLKPGEKWIDVNVTNDTLVAYEGDKAVFATAVSTGKRDDKNPDKDHKTPTGTWRIREKHIAATMDGDVASDGPYSIEDVPWIMYFNGSYALHGAFWHNNFGRKQSHGCVNLAPQDAKALFGWTEPRMPDGWHGVWSTPEKLGTRVVVHE
ncbi:hypothetical protein AKJ09_09591 [Labilithrix luteola]|uniref:L,D-TPase catalytic domain-containing protein n=1 Tax=Labilithrix luteola TaxID=1391654 RepID=A0A0K1QB18_9BACT|nr:L,D-transpeptidase [Labilithrix luteola]AKV02928.1 hypothetical protein AKJ09_09591 [Labilithrix luteola]